MSPQFSDRISILRFIMIAGIVLVHIPSAPPDLDPDIFPYIKVFSTYALLRVGVPMLTCISGFLLFRACLDQNVTKLLAKKTKTLVIPFLAANIPIVALIYIGQANGFFADFRNQLYPFDLTTFLNASFALQSAPLNFPLHFLRNLFVLVLLAPAFGILLRNVPWVGLLIVCGIALFNLDGPLVIRDTMIINFYIGGMAAVLKWDVAKLDRFAPAFAAILIGVCLVIVGFWIKNLEFFRVVSPILIWPISSMIVGQPIGNLCKRLSHHSFFIFLTHAPVIMVLWNVYLNFHVIPYEVFWIGSPIVTIAICIVSHKLLISATRQIQTAYRF